MKISSQFSEFGAKFLKLISQSIYFKYKGLYIIENYMLIEKVELSKPKRIIYLQRKVTYLKIKFNIQICILEVWGHKNVSAKNKTL